MLKNRKTLSFGHTAALFNWALGLRKQALKGRIYLLVFCFSQTKLAAGLIMTEKKYRTQQPVCLPIEVAAKMHPTLQLCIVAFLD